MTEEYIKGFKTALELAAAIIYKTPVTEGDQYGMYRCILAPDRARELATAIKSIPIQ